jgi:hypothetical protein
VRSIKHATWITWLGIKKEEERITLWQKRAWRYRSAKRAIYKPSELIILLNPFSLSARVFNTQSSFWVATGQQWSSVYYGRYLFIYLFFELYYD